MPYIYTAARESYDTGIPITRPMYLGSPDSSAAYKFDSQYMFGSQLLFAPVASAGDPARKRIWFPPGDVDRRVQRQDVRRARRSGPCRSRSTRPPCSPAAGAIVPRQRDVDHLGAGAPSPLLVDVYAGASNRFTLYEDSGDGLEYRNGEFARTPLRWSEGKKTKRFTVAPVTGGYPGMKPKRRYRSRSTASASRGGVFVGKGARRHHLERLELQREEADAGRGARLGRRKPRNGARDRAGEVGAAARLEGGAAPTLISKGSGEESRVSVTARVFRALRSSGSKCESVDKCA